MNVFKRQALFAINFFALCRLKLNGHSCFLSVMYLFLLLLFINLLSTEQLS